MSIWVRSRAFLPLVVALMWVASLAIYIVIPKSLGFYYYYYLSSICLCFALPMAFDLLDPNRRLALAEWFTAASLVMFIYFYPIIASVGLTDSQGFLNWMWFSGWL